MISFSQCAPVSRQYFVKSLCVSAFDKSICIRNSLVWSHFYFFPSEEREIGTTAPCQQPAAWCHYLLHQIAKIRKNPLQLQAEVLPLDTLEILFHLCPAKPFPRLQQPGLGVGKAWRRLIAGITSALSFNCSACSCTETSSLLHCTQCTEKLHTMHCTLVFTHSLFTLLFLFSEDGCMIDLWISTESVDGRFTEDAFLLLCLGITI